MKDEAFDIERAIRESNLPAETVEQILQDVREEYPDEDLMYELHVIRALQAEVATRLPPGMWGQLINQGITPSAPPATQSPQTKAAG